MQRLTAEHVTYRFAPDLEPTLSVKPGDRLQIETLDSWSGRLRRPEDIHTVPFDPSLANPATGPIAIIGAEPGDALIVQVEDIVVHPPGFAKIVPAGGILGGEVQSPYLRLVDVEGGEVVLKGWLPDRNLKLPLRPMIGVVGVAPPQGSISTLWPGDHGGNLDINAVCPGSRVYLPVSVPGALFALGDVHATMGDGELSGAGVDICSTVTLVIDLAKGRGIKRPLLETPSAWITCAAAPSLLDAVRIATRDMVGLLSTQLGLAREDALLLVSACGDARIGEACGSDVPATAWVSVPRSLAGGGS